MKKLLIILGMLAYLSANAQTAWEKDYGITSQNHFKPDAKGCSIKYTDNGTTKNGYVTAVTTTEPRTYLIVSDDDGNTHEEFAFQSSYSNNGNIYNHAPAISSIKQIDVNIFVAVGQLYKNICSATGVSDVFVAYVDMTNPNNNWTKVYGEQYIFESASDVILDSDGDIVIIGYSKKFVASEVPSNCNIPSNYTVANGDIATSLMMLKINQSGGYTLANSQNGGMSTFRDYQTGNQAEYQYYPRKIIENQSGTYTIVGTAYSNQLATDLGIAFVMNIEKDFDGSGNLQAGRKRFPFDLKSNCYSIIENANDHFLMVGDIEVNSNNSNPEDWNSFIVEIKSDLKSKTNFDEIAYFIFGKDKNDHAVDIINTCGNEYLIAGYTNSFASNSTYEMFISKVVNFAGDKVTIDPATGLELRDNKGSFHIQYLSCGTQNAHRYGIGRNLECENLIQHSNGVHIFGSKRTTQFNPSYQINLGTDLLTDCSDFGAFDLDDFGNVVLTGPRTTTYDKNQSSSNLTLNSNTNVTLDSKQRCPIPPDPFTTNLNEIDESNDKSVYALYPNPVTQVLTIEGFSSRSLVKISDQNGRVIKEFTTTENSQQIDMSGLKSNLYLITITNEEGQNTFKVIKE